MKEQINALITRLLDNSLAPGEVLEEGVSFDSSKTVFAKAAKEIAELPEEAIETVKEILISEKNNDRRSQAYSILSVLSKKFQNPELVYFIIERLALEKSKNLISLHLQSDLKLSKQVDIVLDFTKRKEWQIRHSAIQLLAKYTTDKDKIETLLIDILKTSKDQYDLLYTLLSIGEVGSKKAVDSIKAVLVENNKTDVLSVGINALGKLDGENQVDFFMDLMRKKKDSYVKYALTEQITKFADDRAIDLIIDRIKTLLTKARTTNWGYYGDYKPEFVHAMEYLQKYESQNDQIGKLFTWVLEKKTSFLDETESTWFNENFKMGVN